ncbi:MAG TPA: hypothetical protein GXX18_08460 [Bacillales bacterium]|nr:hypothetical protein [Bacillales bacterium]
MVKRIWSTFWYQNGKVRQRIWLDDDRYIVSSTISNVTAYNYGSTPEIAKESSLYKLQKVLNKKEKNRKYITRGNDYVVLYRVK